MIITSDQLPDLWRQMVYERANSAEKSLVVLHSISEVDSACATRLLMVSHLGPLSLATMQLPRCPARDVA